MYKLMTPGPTQVLENVRMSRSLACTNPDLDTEFVEFYKETCELISSLLHTKNETLILNGEGILGLEAACASLTEANDKVLILDNGIYGKGFADFVNIYQGVPEIYHADYKHTLNVDDLAAYLKDHHDFKYATVVHCDTPSGMLNDISRICPLLKQYNILTVVDSVSAMFGEPLDVDQFQIDLLCGGSQKAVSAPPGLTFVTISDDAKKAIKNRRTPIASFYANLKLFENYYETKWFPYTMPISDIYGLRTAFNNIAADHKLLNRHKIIGEATRNTLQAAGIKLHLESGFSNTVTVFDTPDQVHTEWILDKMKSEHGIMLAGSFDDLAGKVIRIGHMGANATISNMIETLSALDTVLRELNVSLHVSLSEYFLHYVNSNPA
ncbi:MAG: alanine--glyoxylate aminotransferase family protein [Eubacterium sp.]|nr:alanine--glyoxylate aminotransferase family protein [Eubacterium sp.]MCI8918920.1 alanine--glyoxylate aminotransferase family protein [Eubacterium sp.]